MEKSVEGINRSLGSARDDKKDARDDKRTPGMTGIPVINDKILIFNIILLNINSSY